MVDGQIPLSVIVRYLCSSLQACRRGRAAKANETARTQSGLAGTTVSLADLSATFKVLRPHGDISRGSLGKGEAVQVPMMSQSNPQDLQPPESQITKRQISQPSTTPAAFQADRPSVKDTLTASGRASLLHRHYHSEAPKGWPRCVQKRVVGKTQQYRHGPFQPKDARNGPAGRSSILGRLPCHRRIAD